MKLKINKKAFDSNLASLIFLLLFPGFFFYSYAVARAAVYALPGGWFGVFTSLSFVLLIPIVLMRLPSSKGLVLKFLFVFFLLLCFIGAWAVSHYLMGAPVQKSADALKGSIQILVFGFVFFFTGFFFSPRKWFGFALYISFFGMLFLILLHFDPSRMMFYAKEQFIMKKGVADYQGFARSFALTAIMLLAISRRLYAQAAIIVLSLFALYLLLARSEFFGFIFVVLIAGWVILLRSSLSVKVLFILLFILFMSSFFWLPGSEFSNRQFEVLKLTESTSVAKRIEFLQEGWNQIKKSAVFGDYAGQLREGGFGSYIHNGLSAWRQFGILGFGMYFGLSMLSLFIATREVIFRRNKEFYWKAALYMNLYTFLLMLVAKSVFGNLAPLAWGFTMNAVIQGKKHFFPGFYKGRRWLAKTY